MAATRLIALHVNKGKSFKQSLAGRIDYIKNEKKTEGEYISCYQCDSHLVEEQFAMSKAEYEKKTGRTHGSDVIAYQIRQSFKPGEITPEEANKVGYETAMRYLKGNNAFIVATHTDKEHIHNHIIFNSVDITAEHKYRDRLRSGMILAKVSDIVCIEHGLSVIKPKDRQKQKNHPQYISHSFRGDMRGLIDYILESRPSDMEEFVKMLREQGYEVKQGKYISVKGNEQKGYIRLRSLGFGYREEDIAKRITGEITVDSNYAKRSGKIDLLVDIQKKLSEGKGGGYERWAKVYNIKQMAKTIVFLQEHNVRNYDYLAMIASDKTKNYNNLLDEIKTCDNRIKEIKSLKAKISDYAKTRDIYMKYKTEGYSKVFYEVHRSEIEIHKAARKTFSEMDRKVPKTSELNLELAELIKRKNKAYREYQQVKKEMKDYQTAKINVDMFYKNVRPIDKTKER